MVQDILETQLGREEVKYKAFDANTGTSSDGAFSKILKHTKSTGENFDFINMSFSTDTKHYKPDAEDPKRLGGLESAHALHFRQYGQERKLEGTYEDWSASQRRELADFVQNYAAGRIRLTPAARAYERANRGLADVVFLGKSIAQGRELMKQGSNIVMAAGNHRNALTGFTLLREYNGESKGQAISVGATTGDILGDDKVHRPGTNGEGPSNVASSSSQRGVDAYANGHYNFNHLAHRTHFSTGSGTSFATPELIAALVKSRSKTDNLEFHKNIPISEQEKVFGPLSGDRVFSR